MASNTSLSERALLDPWVLFDDLPANLSVVGSAERAVFANRCWQATFNPSGIPLEDVDLGAALHPDDVAGARDAWHAATERGEPFAYRYRVRGRHGEYRLFSIHGWPTFPSPTGDWQYACVATDIDDAFRYEAYLAVLAEIGTVAASIGECDEMLERIGALLVPLAAGCFVVYRPATTGELAPQTIVDVDPERAEALRAMWRMYPAACRRFVDLAVNTSDAVVIRPLTSEQLVELAADEEHLALLRAYDPRGMIFVPIVGRDELHGALAIQNGPHSERNLGDAELRLVREVARRIALALDSTALASEGRRATDDLRFLAQVGEAMVESLDLPTRLERFVHAVVPRLADWATVNILQRDGMLETLAIAHRDPARAGIADRLRGPYYGEPEANYGTPVALRSGRSILLSDVDDRFLRTHLRPERYEDVIALGADSAFVVPLMSGGEVYGTLSAMRVARDRPFTENDMWLIEELARRAAVAIDNARRFAQHTTVAEAFQHASLPDALPHHARTSFSAFYAPGQREATVGGDWYDAFVLDDGLLVVSIGDVSGSGLAAAVVMGSIRQVIRGASELVSDPRVILDAADRALRTQYPTTLVTAFVGIVDVARRRLTFASAGHPPPLLVTPTGNIRELGMPGLPLGLREDDEPAAETSAYVEGSLLVLYTDGLIESTRDVIAGQAALHAALAESAVRSAPNLARAVHDAVLLDGAHDDIAILAVRFDTAS